MIVLIKLIFWVLVPVVIIYFRSKKKYQTGFAIGMLLTSILIGVLLSATLQSSLVDDFIGHMNSNNFEKAERDFRIILQRNPDDIKLVETTKIINRVKYDRMKKKLYNEYIEIAEKNLDNAVLPETDDCKDIVNVDKKRFSLEHALRLVMMAEAIGPGKTELKRSIRMRRDKFDELLARLQKQCR